MQNTDNASIEALVQACQASDNIPRWMASQLETICAAVSMAVPLESYWVTPSALWVTHSSAIVEVKLVGKLRNDECEVASLNVELRLMIWRRTQLNAGCAKFDVELAWRPHASFDFLEYEDVTDRLRPGTVGTNAFSLAELDQELPSYRTDAAFRRLATVSIDQATTESLLAGMGHLVAEVLPTWARDVIPKSFEPIVTLAKAARARMLSPTQVMPYFKAALASDATEQALAVVSDIFDTHLQTLGLALKYRVHGVLVPLRRVQDTLQHQAQVVGSLVAGADTLGTVMLTCFVTWHSAEQYLERKFEMVITFGDDTVLNWGFPVNRLPLDASNVLELEKAQPWVTTINLASRQWSDTLQNRITMLENLFIP